MKYTDKQLLDFLQKLLDRNEYTGKCICRTSLTNRGFRLHETSHVGAVSDVRKAISNFMDVVNEYE